MLGLNDVSPVQGELQFSNLQASQSLVISVLNDDIPENDEVFTLQLMNPSGGATLANTRTQAQLTISSNDVPIRFSSPTIEVDESAGGVLLTLSRGSLANGVSVGSLATVSTVQFSTNSGTAMAGNDYQATSGTATFASGSATQQISIPLIDDTLPEGDELFTVTLSNPSPDAVIISPSSVTVTITVNDNAGGVIRFKSTDPVIISEDAGQIASLVIERTVGTVEDVSVAWSIQDSLNKLANNDFNPSSGTVTILNGQSEAVLSVQATNDNVPEEAEQFTVTIDAVVGGNGQLDDQTLRVAPLIVADSDDVYGLVEINALNTAIVVNGVSSSIGSSTIVVTVISLLTGCEDTPVSSGTFGRYPWAN